MSLFLCSVNQKMNRLLLLHRHVFPCLLNVVLCIFLSDSLHVHVYIAEICEQEVIASMYLIYM